MTAPLEAWWHHPEATTLLAELGANPPEKRWEDHGFGDGQLIFTDMIGRNPRNRRAGNPVRRLRKLYRDYGDTFQNGDTSPRWLRYAMSSVDHAIDSAIADHAERAVERRAAA